MIDIHHVDCLGVLRFGSVCSGIGRKADDLSGQRFGRLLVIERVQNHATVNRPTWRCSCDCGASVDVLARDLRGGRNKSCGCFRRDRAGHLYRKHGKSKTAAYTMFYDARKRAQRRGLPFDIEPDDIVIPEACPVLGIALDGSSRDSTPSLDRVVPAKGYVRGNIAVISFRANRIKSDANAEELRSVLAYLGAAQ